MFDDEPPFLKNLEQKVCVLKKKIKKCLTGSFLFLICLVNVFFPLPFCTTVTLCKFVLACVQCLHMKYMIKPSVDNHIHKDRVEKLFSFSVDNHLSSFICMWLNIKQWTVFCHCAFVMQPLYRTVIRSPIFKRCFQPLISAKLGIGKQPKKTEVENSEHLEPSGNFLSKEVLRGIAAWCCWRICWHCKRSGPWVGEHRDSAPAAVGTRCQVVFLLKGVLYSHGVPSLSTLYSTIGMR